MRDAADKRSRILTNPDTSLAKGNPQDGGTGAPSAPVRRNEAFSPLHGRLLHLLLLCAGVAVAVFVTQFDSGRDSAIEPGPLFQESVNSIENSPSGQRALYAAAPLVPPEDSGEPAQEGTATVRAGSEPGSQALAAAEEGLAYSTYVIEEGDNLQRIARKFELREETLVNNNYDLEASDYSEPGQQIIVLATDGMLHTVKYGEDLFFIADLYRTAPEQIVNYGPNGLADADDLSVGRVLVVPEGEPPAVQVAEGVDPEETDDAEEENEDATAEADETEPADEEDEDDPTPEPTEDEPAVEESTPEPTEEPPPPPPSDGGSVDGWVWPVSGCGITRGVSGSHAGIDIDLFCNPGATVVAAASGTVIYAGWDGGYGNSVVIDHGNGLFSRYAHLSSVSVSSGQSVGAGQTIGVSGSTGNSSGEHLHFEIREGSAYGTILDPLAYLP